MDNQDWDARSCPSCASQVFSNSPSVSSSIRAENLSYNEIKKYFIGFRDNQIFFSYYRCNECLLLYCPWYFSSEQLSNLYSDMPDNLLGEDKSVISRTQSGYVNQIAKHINQIEIFLEVGPDIGLVTNSIVKRFQPKVVLLVEPNESIHPQLRQRALPTKSINIYLKLSLYIIFTIVPSI
jgi:hypothetical protein